jgi:hypothetical protein
MSAIAAIIGRKIEDCSKDVLARHGGDGEGREIEVRHQAALHVCSQGFSLPAEEYHRQASDRFEAELPKTREEMERKEERARTIGRVVLPILFGPIALFLTK